MAAWKPPPVAKVYEAMSAVLDGRCELLLPDRAVVHSSDRSRTYHVRWNDSGDITSDDPASRFQGYIGYPIIAVLLATDRLSWDAKLAAPLLGVPWKGLNDRFKRDYDAAVDHVLSELPDDGRAVRGMAERVYEDLLSLRLQKLTSRNPGGS
jgi:hypothetical protein